MRFMDDGRRAHLGSRDFTLKAEDARRNAQFHLYSVVAARFRGVEGWENGRIAARPMVVYDLSGLPLFYDFPVNRGKIRAGFIRTAANKALGEPIIATQVTSPGWDIRTARIEFAKLIKKKYPEYRVKRPRLVCYSYPKLALSTELESPRRETRSLLMDVGDFTEIPPEPVSENNKSGLVPYSLLGEIPEKREITGTKNWDKRNREVEGFFSEYRKLDPTRMYKLKTKERLAVIDRTFVKIIKLYEQNVIDFCCHTGDCKDHECFCLHPQENSVHCTRASSQMVLCYWRYCYSQHDIAQAFGVNDNELTWWSSVAPGLNSLTRDCFTGSLNYFVSWSDCVNEIKNRRPFLSDTGGHTRACAGTKQWNIWVLGQPQPEYLYIFDPWPVDTGAIYWEDFNSTNYAWIGTLVRKTTNHT